MSDRLDGNSIPRYLMPWPGHLKLPDWNSVFGQYVVNARASHLDQFILYPEILAKELIKDSSAGMEVSGRLTKVKMSSAYNITLCVMCPTRMPVKLGSRQMAAARGSRAKWAPYKLSVADQVRLPQNPGVQEPAKAFSASSDRAAVGAASSLTAHIMFIRQHRLSEECRLRIGVNQGGWQVF